MAEELRKLGAEIDTQFIYRPSETDMAHALAAVKGDQEAICGYKLILLKERSMALADAQGPYVEVFVTFGPYPVVTEEQITADRSLAPPEPGPPPPRPLQDGTLLPPGDGHLRG